MEERYLGRNDAPLEGGTWKAIDAVMSEAARSVLSGRRLLNIEGPYGLGLKAVPLQDTEEKNGLITSNFLQVTLIQATFQLSKRDLTTYEREGLPFDLAPVAKAAISVASREDALIFKGAQGVPGLLTAKGIGSQELSSWEGVGTAAEDVIKAVTVLDEAGFHGPYSLALAPGLYNQLYRRYPESAFTELEHIRSIVTEGVFKAPALDSGGVLIASGRQYASIVVGQDMTVGFIGPVGEKLEFSVTESLAPWIRIPAAICALK
ncbi:MAG: bacteriocin [Methanobacteriota archaeon]|nr:MAG: bacteriocin [Euryarchaeota archaeon]